ncbi:MAG: glycosyltransferase family 2 protein [Alphaproteobacteria bacterium]|nr:glycosyltransferase family 2 protein [Alphaproteobacteria bacterium]
MEQGVSFVIPVFNKEAWLPDVLDSIRAQTGDFAREHVFVDDGSSDASMEVVRARTADWPNVVIREQDNHGSAHATNRGIEAASMPFVKFVDADDLMPRRATETLLAALAAHPECCLAWGDLENFDSPDELDLDAFPDAPSVEVIADPLKRALHSSMFNPTQIIVRRAALLETGGCDERVVHSQEYGMSLRLARRWPFAKVDATVAYQYRVMPGGLSFNRGRQLGRVTRAAANFIRDFPDLPLDARQFACRRAAGRAWNFRRRNHGATVLSPWFARYLRAKLPMRSGHAEFMDRCVAAFETDAA